MATSGRRTPSWFSRNLLWLILPPLLGAIAGVLWGPIEGLTVSLVALALLVLLWGGYAGDWYWTGFAPRPPAHPHHLSHSSTPPSPTKQEPEKKLLWDWMSLLIVPLVLATGGIWFNMQQNAADNARSDEQHRVDLNIADNQTQDTVLDTYIDRLSDLLLTSNLGNSSSASEVAAVARARTITVLQRFHPDTLRGGYSDRKGLLLRFLFEAGLINTPVGIVNLASANLTAANLGDLALKHVDGKDCAPPVNSHAPALSRFDFDHADLQGVDLAGANLAGTILDDSNLTDADLTGANLTGAHLTGVTMFRTKLTGAILDDAVLSDAALTNDQLKEARSLKCTTLPDGSQHDNT